MPMHNQESSLCPVCGHPKPEGLRHCSLRCEEADGEGASIDGMTMGDLKEKYPEPIEGCYDDRD